MNHKKFRQVYVHFYKKRFAMSKKPVIAVIQFFDSKTGDSKRFYVKADSLGALGKDLEIKEKCVKTSELYLHPAQFEKVFETLKNTMDHPTQVHVKVFWEILSPMPEFHDLLNKIEPDNASLYDIMKIMTLGGF